jgi:hypothetical protein
VEACRAGFIPPSNIRGGVNPALRDRICFKDET